MIVDTSRYQQQYNFDVQPIDFERARDEGGVTHAIPRALQGIHEGDPFFPAAFNGWKRAGVKVGAYHPFYPSQHPRQQAKTLAQLLRAVGYDIAVDGPTAGDFELTQGIAYAIIRDKVRAYFEELEDQLAAIPWNYTGPWWWDPVIGAQPWARRYPLWVADHRLVPRPQLPLGYESFELWQYKSEGQIAGIAGLVDLSRPRLYHPPAPGVYRVSVTANALRIRRGPSTADAIVGWFAKGEIVEVFDELGDWLRISPAEAAPAWIHGSWAVRIDT